jgi:WhiB family redox-sensing transcriptional regulator
VNNLATVTAFPTGRTPDELTDEQLYRTVTTDGICVGQPDDETYFPNRAITPAEASDACGGCPVRAECLERALRLNISYGIFGGTTPEQRQSMRRSAQRLAIRMAVAS